MKRAAFQRLMAAKEGRIAVMRQLLKQNGVALSSEVVGLHALINWFRREVEGDRATGRVAADRYGVVKNLALFLGDAIVATSPENPKWVMFDKGSRGIAFQRHVIMGFSGVANPKYNVDIDRLVATYGHRILAGEQVKTETFATWVAGAASKA